MYKSINNLISSPINFTLRGMGPYNIRNPQPLVLPFHNSVQSALFIHVRGATLWNELPQNIRNSRTVVSFKNRIKKAYLDSYE